jgi:hypothetical protein
MNFAKIVGDTGHYDTWTHLAVRFTQRLSPPRIHLQFPQTVMSFMEAAA